MKKKKNRYKFIFKAYLDEKKTKTNYQNVLCVYSSVTVRQNVLLYIVSQKTKSK